MLEGKAIAISGDVTAGYGTGASGVSPLSSRSLSALLPRHCTYLTVTAVN